MASETPYTLSNSPANTAANQLPNNTEQRSSHDGQRNTLHPIEQPSEHGSQPTTEQLGEQPSEHDSQQVTEQLGEQPSEHNSQQNTEQLGKQPSEHNSQQVSKSISKSSHSSSSNSTPSTPFQATGLSPIQSNTSATPQSTFGSSSTGDLGVTPHSIDQGRREAALRLQLLEIPSHSYTSEGPEIPQLDVSVHRSQASQGDNIREVGGFARTPKQDIINDPRYESFEVPFRWIPRAFDTMADYNVENHYVSKHVEVEWLDPPALFPYDIRARHANFFVSDKAFEDGPDKLVWRSIWRCSGNCCQVEAPRQTLAQVLAERKGSSLSEDLDETSPPPASSPLKTQSSKGLPQRCAFFAEPCHAHGQQIRMTPRQIHRAVCTLIRARIAYHGEPQPLHLLRLSPYVRNLLHDAATMVGTTESRLKIRWDQHFCQYHQYVTWAKKECPWRLPKDRDFTTAIRTALRRERLDKLPLAAIAIVHAANPESFLSYQYPSSLQLGGVEHIPKDEEFLCVIAPKHALQSAIRHAREQGLAMDSSWRNKNAIRCPVTFLTTVNEYGHMVPVAVMVSNHANTDTYTHFLETVREAIENEARALVSGKSDIVSSAEDKDSLLMYADDIAFDGFTPLFVMIDCDDAERNAVEEVFPGTPVRLCQFHFMQAARSRGQSIFGRDPTGCQKVSQFLAGLRDCQRCDDEEHWDETYARFQVNLASLTRNNTETCEDISRWLESWWFSDRWRPALVDYGLPANHTRDGTLSTNNFVEAAFRTFDRVFLEARANKRIDRLIVIIINVYFPMYLHSPPTSGRCDPQVREVILLGLDLWQVNAVRLCPPNQCPELPVRLRATYKVQYAHLSSGSRDPPQVHYCGIIAGSQREWCSCSFFNQRGKRCGALWAFYCYRNCGSQEAYVEEITTIASSMSLSSGTKREHQRVDTSLDADREDLIAWWGHDPTEPVERYWSTTERPTKSTAVNIDSEHLDSLVRPLLPPLSSPIGRRHTRNRARLQPPPEDSQVSSQLDGHGAVDRGGRPAHTRPLHPGRSRKPPKSHIAFRPEKLPSQQRPVGAVNHQQSCFAQALFHVLLRLPTFAEGLDAIKQPLRHHLPGLTQILENFHHCISTSHTVVDIPTMVDVLRREGFIDEQAQHDPCELFERISVQIRHDPTLEHYMQVLHIHPARFNTVPSPVPVTMSQMIEHAFWRQLLPRPCSTCGQLAPTRARATLSKDEDFTTEVLVLNVVWDLRDASASVGPSISRFSIEEELNPRVLSGISPSSPSEQPFTFKLGGMICRKGALLARDTGHYVALIQKGGYWWDIDDEKVTRLNFCNAAFESTRFPVMLFYQREHLSLSENQSSATPHTPRPDGGPTRSAIAKNPTEMIKSDIPSSQPSIPSKGSHDRSSSTLSNTATSLTLDLELTVPLQPRCRLAITRSEVADRLQKVLLGPPETTRALVSVKPFGGITRVNVEAINSICMALWHDAAKKEPKSQRPSLYLEDIRTDINAVDFQKWLSSPDGWYSMFGIQDIVSAINRLFRVLNPGTQWLGGDSGQCPWPSLGKDGSWRKQVTVSVVMIQEDAHFGVVVIFGPQKLVVMLDGTAGKHDTLAFKKNWPTLLASRLSWEVKHHFATEEVGIG
ncbi:hypothetical protein TREMEDRAFT_65496 [Tremella mesenterica DSM 1558]|uniref:uncharacterized protein n=1 Tax=Tremella mesenterica (strain ATCC 24925 / CBS 8224 / DSM 1558 / NBRC 9311 / NRRL Y-6157 / RJB 2259-6 / UBC 559-6) TaxID=578456 RepID=UPI00032CAB4B|nr:uncharacterized protein TREMEDRAFT_65496 [Tremella mesenterica DSM 1558]EIW66628.1 hypothetical protein TREMEDRAFT_65496 [Tremella mesenterica DSM 1558]